MKLTSSQKKLPYPETRNSTSDCVRIEIVLRKIIMLLDLKNSDRAKIWLNFE